MRRTYSKNKWQYQVPEDLPDVLFPSSPSSAVSNLSTTASKSNQEISKIQNEILKIIKKATIMYIDVLSIHINKAMK